MNVNSGLINRIRLYCYHIYTTKSDFFNVAINLMTD